MNETAQETEHVVRSQSESWLDEDLYDFLESTKPLARSNAKNLRDLVSGFLTAMVTAYVLAYGIAIVHKFTGWGDFPSASFLSDLPRSFVFTGIMGLVLSIFFCSNEITGFRSFKSKRYRIIGTELAMVFNRLQSKLADGGKSLSHELDQWRLSHIFDGDGADDAASLIQKFYVTGQYKKFLTRSSAEEGFLSKGAKERMGAHLTDFFLRLSMKIFIAVAVAITMIIIAYFYINKLQLF